MLKDSPLVSIIIPYFNSGKTIQETIDSVFNQSYKNFDIWIVNDGSTDIDSIEKLKDFEDHNQIHIINQKNFGPSTARNNAINRSKAEYIVFLDSDDLIEKYTLTKGLNFIGEADVLFGDCILFGEKNEIKKQQIPSKEAILNANPIAICAIFRASIFSEIQFDSYLDKLGLEDWELWIHLSSKDFKFVYIEEIFFQIRVNENSRTYNVANKNIEETKKYIFNKHSYFLYLQFVAVSAEKKEVMRLIDLRLGRFILKPYRFFKHNFIKK
jgi:glycosyltransferase involved in cell wall biosynthesis